LGIHLSDIILAIGLSFLVVIVFFWRGSLSKSGAVGGLLVGTIIFGFGGLVWGVLLAIFFISSSLLSHYKEEQKSVAAEKFDKGHRRDMGQVLANGGLGSIVVLLNFLFESPIWLPLYIGIMATVTADTWATELGTLARKPPRLITNGQVVAVGTSGGITPLGAAVSLSGGILIGLVAGFLSSEIQWSLGILIGALAGLLGSLTDSLLGATVQQIYYCDQCGKDTERKVHKCGYTTRRLRGWFWLNNDLVNLIASAAGGLVALLSWSFF